MFKTLKNLKKIVQTNQFNQSIALRNLHRFSTYTNLYEEHYNRSTNPETREQFWREQAENIDWFSKSDTIIDKSNKNAGFWRWFPDWKLNVSYNAIDRHYKTTPDQPAIEYYSSMTNTETTVTYGELYTQVSKLASVLKNEFGIKKGDKVIIYMPLIPEALYAMLAVTRLGAIHSVVFGGFAAHELSNRINNLEPSLVISASCGIEPNNRIIKYKQIVDEACKESQYNGKTLIVQREQFRAENLTENDYDYYDLMEKETELTEAVPVLGSDPHYVLYTSGSTGQPKGILRDQAGSAIAGAYSMKYIMGINKGDCFFAASDIGWVVGHSYICYGPLIAGSTTVLYEGKPVDTPDAGIYWKLIEKYNIKGLYTAPTALRAIRKADENLSLLKNYDIKSLELLNIVGERLDSNTSQWLRDNFKNQRINDTFWQTETGWPITCNFHNLEWFDVEKGSCGKPVPGYDIKIMDENNEVIEEKNKLGKLCIKLPMPPSFMQTVWRNDESFNRKYLEEVPGYYLAGDSGYFDESGCIHIQSRIDDVINTAGHRLACGQLEQILIHHDEIVEAAVVGKKDDLKGEIPFGFVVVKEEYHLTQNQVEKQCISMIREELGPVAAFKHCMVVNKLPKTRSGKILRQSLRKMVNGERIEKAPPTIEDESVLDIIFDQVQEYEKTAVY